MFTTPFTPTQTSIHDAMTSYVVEKKDFLSATRAKENPLVLIFHNNWDNHWAAFRFLE